MLGEIRRARASDQANASDPRRHQRGVRKNPDPHRDVEPLLDQIDDAVDEEQPRGDVREGLEKRDHDGHDVEAAEHGRRGDGNLAARL
jgi:hypothetical protein